MMSKTIRIEGSSLTEQTIICEEENIMSEIEKVLITVETTVLASVEKVWQSWDRARAYKKVECRIKRLAYAVR